MTESALTVADALSLTLQAFHEPYSSAQNSIPDALSQLLVWTIRLEPALVLNRISPIPPLYPPLSPYYGSVACRNHPLLCVAPGNMSAVQGLVQDKFHAV